eukprot:11116600-Heterocapsa_arctica.AAC.1
MTSLPSLSSDEETFPNPHGFAEWDEEVGPTSSATYHDMGDEEEDEDDEALIARQQRENELHA